MLRHDHPTSTAWQHTSSASPPPRSNTAHQQASEVEEKGKSRDQTHISHLSNPHTFCSAADTVQVNTDGAFWDASRREYCFWEKEKVTSLDVATVSPSTSKDTDCPPWQTTSNIICHFRFNSHMHQYYICVHWQHSDWDLLPPPPEGMLEKSITPMVGLLGLRREAIHPQGELFRWVKLRYMVGGGTRLEDVALWGSPSTAAQPPPNPSRRHGPISSHYCADTPLRPAGLPADSLDLH